MARVTHIVKTTLQMRHPILTGRRMPQISGRLPRHDEKLHTPGHDASPATTRRHPQPVAPPRQASAGHPPFLRVGHTTQCLTRGLPGIDAEIVEVSDGIRLGAEADFTRAGEGVVLALQDAAMVQVDLEAAAAGRDFENAPAAAGYVLPGSGEDGDTAAVFY